MTKQEYAVKRAGLKRRHGDVEAALPKWDKIPNAKESISEPDYSYLLRQKLMQMTVLLWKDSIAHH